MVKVFHIVGFLHWSAAFCESLNAELYNQKESLRKGKMKTLFLADLLGNLHTTENSCQVQISKHSEEENIHTNVYKLHSKLSSC